MGKLGLERSSLRTSTQVSPLPTCRTAPQDGLRRIVRNGLAGGEVTTPATRSQLTRTRTPIRGLKRHQSLLRLAVRVCGSFFNPPSDNPYVNPIDGRRQAQSSTSFTFFLATRKLVCGGRLFGWGERGRLYRRHRQQLGWSDR